MRITRHIHPIATALCIAAVAAGCGSDSPTAPEPEPEPETTTLILDFAPIDVLEDCDGIEGDGDFQFQILTGESGSLAPLYNQSISLPPGGTTGAIGRRSYTFAITDRTEIGVQFTAWEWDRDFFGTTYADERLSGATQVLWHVLYNGAWSGLQPRSIVLGSNDCIVKLSWTATSE